MRQTVFLLNTGRCFLVLLVALGYAAGLHDYLAGFLNSTFLLLFSGPVILLLLTVLVARVARRLETKKGIIAFLVLAYLVLGTLIEIGFYAGEKPQKLFARGFRDAMRRSLGVGTLQTWRKELIEAGRAREVFPGIPRDQWPTCVRDLDPRFVDMEKDGLLYLTWGGQFFHYGLVVGSSAGPEARSGKLPLTKEAYVRYSVD